MASCLLTIGPGIKGTLLFGRYVPGGPLEWSCFGFISLKHTGFGNLGPGSIFRASMPITSNDCFQFADSEQISSAQSNLIVCFLSVNLSVFSPIVNCVN